MRDIIIITRFTRFLFVALKKLTDVTGDTLGTSSLFERLSIASQRGNEISIAVTLPDIDCWGALPCSCFVMMLYVCVMLVEYMVYQTDITYNRQIKRAMYERRCAVIIHGDDVDCSRCSVWLGPYFLPAEWHSMGPHPCASVHLSERQRQIQGWLLTIQ